MEDSIIGILMLIFFFILPLVNKIRDDQGKEKKESGSATTTPHRQKPPRRPRRNLMREIEQEAERESRRQQRRLKQLKRQQRTTPPPLPEEESYTFDDADAPVEGTLVVPLPADEMRPTTMTSSLSAGPAMKPLSTDSTISMRSYRSRLRPSDYILRRKMDEQKRLAPLQSADPEGSSIGQELFRGDDPQQTLREAILRAEILRRRFPHL